MPRFLVVLDVDSTLIEDEVVELLADEAGSRAEVAAVTDRAMRGELDFAQSLRDRVATLAGLSTDVLADVADRVRLSPGARDLVEGVHAADGAVAVVSGGFLEVLDPVAVDLGLDRWHANRLGAEAGLLTGLVEGPVVDAREKAVRLRAWADELGVPLERTVAVGDGANDLLLLDAAQLGVAFDAKPVLRSAADVVLDRRDLSQVLPMLGLRG